MRLHKGYILCDICGENALLPNGKEGVELTGMLHLNETAAEVFRHFSDKDFEEEDIAKFLFENYDVEESTAREGAARLTEAFSALDAFD